MVFFRALVTHKKKKNAIIVTQLSSHGVFIHVISLGLTFAGLRALKPAVISVSIAGTFTVLVPRTARSATTYFAGSSELAAIWARHHTSDRWGDG